MQIVIDIPDEIYKRVVVSPRCTTPLDAFRDRDIFCKALQNGTPLPKGHGDLIDIDELELDTEWSNYEDGFISYSRNQIKCAKVIIEADTESEGKELKDEKL